MIKYLMFIGTPLLNLNFFFWRDDISHCIKFLLFA